MKIIQVNASYKPAYIYGGPALSVSRLCEGLVKAGADLEVLTTTANGAEELPVKTNERVMVDGVWVTYFKRLTKDHTHFSPGLLGTLNRLLKSRGKNLSPGPVVVHIHAWWNLVSVFSCWIARLNNVAVVLSPRGTLSSYSFGNRNSGMKKYIHRFLGESLLRYCHFHVTSEHEKEDILRIIKPKSITVIPNFVFLPELRPSPPSANISENKEGRTGIHVSRLLFLSRIEEKKGLDILFNALAGSSVPYHLDIAGSGEISYIDKLKELAADLGIENNISWIGQQGQEEKWSVIADHDLLVLTSHSENFANVVIECLATGTPVLISEKVGLADYVAENNLGWICKLSPESVREEIQDAMNDKDKLITIRKTAPAKIRADFEEGRLIDMFRQLYAGISAGEQQRPIQNNIPV